MKTYPHVIFVVAYVVTLTLLAVGVAAAPKILPQAPQDQLLLNPVADSTISEAYPNANSGATSPCASPTLPPQPRQRDS